MWRCRDRKEERERALILCTPPDLARHAHRGGRGGPLGGSSLFKIPLGQDIGRAVLLANRPGSRWWQAHRGAHAGAAGSGKGNNLPPLRHITACHELLTEDQLEQRERERHAEHAGLLKEQSVVGNCFD